MKKSYVYLITCLVNGKQYVGKSNNPDARKAEHFRKSKFGKRKQVIQHAIAKYGTENFTFEVIQECESEEIAYKTEYAIIQEKRKIGVELYNTAPGGGGQIGGYAKDTLEKISDTLKKLWDELPDEEKTQRGNRLQSIAMERRRNMTDEQKLEYHEKISIAKKERKRKPSEESIVKWRETMRKKAEGLLPSIESEKYTITCIYCEQQFELNKGSNWSIKPVPIVCQACRAQRMWEDRRERESREARYFNIACTTCFKEIKPKAIKVTAQRECRSCANRTMWKKKKES